MLNRALLRYLVLLLLPIGFPIAGSSPKTVTAVRTEAAPVCDGQLNEPQWQTGTAAMDFTQFDPVEGGLPTELTSVRLLYDDHALYVGVICYDAKPEQIVKQLTRRDRPSEADRFTVMIDSYHDRHTALVFSTNVSGVQTDGILSQDGNVYDVSWDAVWSVATRHFRDGWVAEFEIPYNALRFSARDDGTYEWGINFRRYISRKKETDEWVMVPRKEMLQISRWGTVQGIRDVTPPLHLDLLPYVSTTGTYKSAGLDQGKPSAYEARMGMDLKYGLARNFTLDAALYPDFGQVEVDQAVLNLTVFEPFFPEKRPFFVEGSQMFAFGTSIDNTSMPLFFSRRIGKSPAGSYRVSAPEGGVVEDNPLVTDILGAAKVTGRTSSGFSLGVIGAATGEENATTKDAAGVRSEIMTEPRGLYTAVRAKQDFGTSWVGAMATAQGHQTQLPGLSGGVDWNLRFDDGGYTFDGYVAGAHSSSSTDRNGMASRLLFSRIAGEHWLYVASADLATRYYNPNDMGYFARPHDRGGYVQALYRENFAEGIFRRYSISLVPESRWNWDGIKTFGQVEATASAEYTNFWRSTLAYRRIMPVYEDEERGIIGLRQLPAANAIQLQVKSDERKNVTATVTGIYEADGLQKKSLIGSLALTLRPASWVELTPTVYLQRTRKEVAWVFPDGNVVDPAVGPEDFSVFGDRDLDEVDMGLRGIMTFTRSLSLQWFVQVLLARGQYSNYQRAATSTTLVPYDYASNPAYTNHDFNESTLNANLLLRWEYMPGSTFYLVWTQSRYGDSGLYDRRFGESFKSTFSLPQENVLMAKVSYLLPL
ncbi:hypothetical protein EHM92_04720 [bacterium]|nr:MAG: hypothetical protein EHM92_04720 [bacterium]